MLMVVCLVKVASPTTSTTNCILKQRIVFDKMFLSKYSEKSFVVTGNTKDHKEELKEMGGRYNSKLSCGSGWIFSFSRKDEVESWVQKKQSSVIWQQTTVPSTTSAISSQPIASPPLEKEKEEVKGEENDLEILFNNFVSYMTPFYKENKKLKDILNDFVLQQKQSSNEEVDHYFSNDNTKLYNHFYAFINSSPIKHTLFQSISKNKFIEHALIKLL